jgi:diacylglycerol kinase family enzyme
MRLGVILNPHARKNRRAGPGREARMRAILAGRGRVLRTDSLEVLGPAVAELLPEVTHLVSDGGDGALNWVIHEVRRLEPDPAKWPVFIPTDGGTIDFVAEKIGMEGPAEAILRDLVERASRGARPEEVVLDSLRVTGEGETGPFDRLGFALAAGGVGQRFFDKYYALPDPDAGTIVRVIARTVADFGLARVPALRRFDRGYAAHLFRPTHARVTIDGRILEAEHHGAIHAGAFDVNLGGVIRVFPLAKEPGVLHLQAGAVGGAGIIRNLPNLVRGRAIVAPAVTDTPGRHMRIEALGEEPLRPILDGERFEGLRWLEVEAGPPIRLGRVRA